MATNETMIDRGIRVGTPERKDFVLRVNTGRARRPERSGVYPPAARDVTLFEAYAGYVASIPHMPSLQQCVTTFLCARRLCTSTNAFTPPRSNDAHHFNPSPTTTGPRSVSRVCSFVRILKQISMSSSCPSSLVSSSDRLHPRMISAPYRFSDASSGAKHVHAHRTPRITSSHEQ